MREPGSADAVAVTTSPPALVARVFSGIEPLGAAAAATAVLSIVGLATLRASGDPSSAAKALLQVVLVVSFVTLSILDVRLATFVVLAELTLFGASGDWTRFGSVSGRIVIDAILVLRTVVQLALTARTEGRRVLGRYGAHALLLTILIPLIWMAIGLAHGNLKSDVVGDGDGVAFLAFALVVVLLVQRGEARWLQDAFFLACAANAVVTAALFALGVTHVISTPALITVLAHRLDVGGAIGTTPNGAFRLYLGSALYLQAALVLTVWRLLLVPWSWWLWALQAIIWVDIYATYTRGLWIAAVISGGVLVMLGSASVRRPLVVSGATIGAFALVIGLAAAAGLSLPNYLASRIATITSTSDKYTTGASSRLRAGDFESSGTWQFLASQAARLLPSRTTQHAFTGAHSLRLVNPLANRDTYAYQYVTLAPRQVYVVESAVDASRLLAPAASGRGLLAWDISDGFVYSSRLTRPARGWRRVSVSLVGGKSIGVAQVRLYAPRGTVYWDDVRLLKLGRLSVSMPVAGVPGLFGPTGGILRNPGFETNQQTWTLHEQSQNSASYSREHTAAHTGLFGAKLVNKRNAKDDYLFENLNATSSTIYVVSAMVNTREVRSGAAGNRGLLAWDAANGRVYQTTIDRARKGWERLRLLLVTGPSPGTLQVRLYAPLGTVTWDDVRVTNYGPLTAGLKVPPEAVPPVQASGSADTAGVVSNHIRIVQARVLWRHIRERPLFGFGFGTIAPDYPYGHIYSYELAYLDILYKTGFVGLLLFLSFPLRLVFDAIRIRFGWSQPASGTSRYEAAAVVALVLGVLVVGITNPIIAAAFGLFPILVCIAWLEPRPSERRAG